MTISAPVPDAPLVLREDHGAVALLTMNSPVSRNSLSVAMLAALKGAFAGVAADPRIRCVVLAANGTVFSAGHDLKEISAHRCDADGGRAFFTSAMTACGEVMQAIVALPQPVIAAVQGMATAAGCQLVATCDLAIAAETAKFSTPGVDIGLFCSTPAVALARAVPRKAAMELLLTADVIGTPEALRIGLINHAVPPAQLLPRSLALAERIAARSAVTLRLGKQSFYRQVHQPLPDAYADAAATMVENLLTEDAVEGIGAFLGKRHPAWQHR